MVEVEEEAGGAEEGAVGAEGVEDPEEGGAVETEPRSIPVRLGLDSKHFKK